MTDPDKLPPANVEAEQSVLGSMLIDPGAVSLVAGLLTAQDFSRAAHGRIYEAIPGKVTISYVAEDMGGQEDLMISPAQIREFLLPGMRRMIGLVHGAGAYAFHHNDGAVRRIVPDMIEAGIDALNPIQWRCPGMEREALKRDFGGRIVFHGGVDNQRTLPFGTAEDVRREVADNLRILGAGGGYICTSAHYIQADTPLENILAMYTAPRELPAN